MCVFFFFSFHHLLGGKWLSSDVCLAVAEAVTETAKDFLDSTICEARSSFTTSAWRMHAGAPVFWLQHCDDILDLRILSASLLKCLSNSVQTYLYILLHTWVRSSAKHPTDDRKSSAKCPAAVWLHVKITKYSPKQLLSGSRYVVCRQKKHW